MYKIIISFSLLVFFVSCKKEISKEIVKKKEAIIQNEVIVKPVYNYTKDFVLGKFNYKNDSSFVKINTNHSSKTIYLNKEVYDAFKQMHRLAKKDEINLIIVSGTRNFYEQKSIWERKWNKYKNLEPLKRAKKILEYSSMPTTSRHHWGTDLDLINLNNSYFDSGKGKEEYEWLLKNANNFGFYQVYTNKRNGRNGYNMEKWHWSYLPLASKYLGYYNENITYSDISDFKGSELAEKTKMIIEYVNGISLKSKTFE